MNEKEKAWEIFHNSQEALSSCFGEFGFFAGFDAGVKVERKRIEKIIEQSNLYHYLQDMEIVKILFPNEGGEA